MVPGRQSRVRTFFYLGHVLAINKMESSIEKETVEWEKKKVKFCIKTDVLCVRTSEGSQSF